MVSKLLRNPMEYQGSEEGEPMKKIVLALAVAVALVNASSAHAGPCATAIPCTVAEPSSFPLLAVNLLVLGGLALIVRKRFPAMK
jgi:hypothetical protein